MDLITSFGTVLLSLLCALGVCLINNRRQDKRARDQLALSNLQLARNKLETFLSILRDPPESGTDALRRHAAKEIISGMQQLGTPMDDVDAEELVKHAASPKLVERVEDTLGEAKGRSEAMGISLPLPILRGNASVVEPPNMPDEFEAILVGRWHTGLDTKQRKALIRIEFTDDREPMVFAMSIDGAKKMGTALANLIDDAAEIEKT